MLQTTTKIYLDNAATTPLCDEARKAMEPYWSGVFGNASSPYAISRAARGAVDAARHQIANLIGAHPDEIVFTSGGTESDNTAILSALEAYPKKREIVTSVVEHPGVLALCEYLEKKRGCKVHRIPVDNRGNLDMAAYRAALSDQVAIVSITSSVRRFG